MASQAGIVVSLDLTITEELQKEGIAREIVRNIQDARKRLGCEIMDKITVSFPVHAAFPTEWTDYICSESMSVAGSIDTPDTMVEVAMDGVEPIVIGIKR